LFCTQSEWLGYNRKSDITITACEADGGTIDNTLWFREMPISILWTEEERIKIAKKWGKPAEYNPSGVQRVVRGERRRLSIF
jgi:hypothetical protein